MTNRALRLSAATLLLGATAVALAPHATSYVASSAVVNAPIHVVRAPFDGVVTAASPEIAAGVPQGGALLAMASARQSRSELETLLAEASRAAGEVDALELEIAALGAVKAELAARAVRHQAEAGAWLAARQDEAAAARRAAEAHRDALRQRVERSETLARRGTAAQATLERERAELAAFEAEVARFAAAEQALAVETRALAAGIAFDGTNGTGTYARQRLDEVTIRLADLATRRDMAQAHRAALAPRVAQARREVERRAGFHPTATGASVIWRASPAEGTPVIAGDDLVALLDCERRFVEVRLPERNFERIARGSAASVRLKGSGAWFPAVVEAVQGAGGTYRADELAIAAVDGAAGQSRVLVRLDPPDVTDADVAALFCDVGRTAAVRFDREGPGPLEALVAGMRDRAPEVVGGARAFVAEARRLTEDLVPEARRLLGEARRLARQAPDAMAEGLAALRQGMTDAGRGFDAAPLGPVAGGEALERRGTARAEDLAGEPS